LATFETDGILIWRDNTEYRITNATENTIYFASVATGRSYDMSIRGITDRLASGNIRSYSPPPKGKMTRKTEGPEMQHCPFCMAAWLNEDLTKPKKECKYCGAGLY
jgi:hypothetical protein